MNVIENYVETMFMNLPESEEMMLMKADILSNMEEKYLELSQKGLSQNEAIGLVISEFGNIDELLNELEIEKNHSQNNKQRIVTMGLEGIDSYLAMRKTASIGIGLGVILSGLASSFIVLGVHFNSVITGVMASLFVVVIAVALFIINGFKFSKYSYLEKGFLLTPKSYEYIQKEQKAFEKSFVVSLIIGISLFIISAVPILIGTQSEENMLLFVPMTITIATIGCFFVIYGGNVKAGYTFLLEHGIDNSITEAELNKRLYWKKFDENFWIIIVAIYLLISFVFGIWEYSWIIFIIAAGISGFWDKDESK